MYFRTSTTTATLLTLIAITTPLRAQDHSTMNHAAMHADGATPLPTLPGQDAYGAIAEVVRLLQHDSTTDWSKVDLEALRAHLIDMNAVTLRSVVSQRAVPGGLEMLVTGDSATAESIRRMTSAHATTLPTLGLAGVVTPVANGVRLVVTAADPRNAALVTQIRGLGFAGVMALGNHHAAHHLAIAKGAAAAGHAAR